jgi:hypothetical protein
MRSYAVLYNDGNLKAQDFRLECKTDGWVPILILRDNEDKITVPMFYNPKTAHKFMRRNISRDIVSGLVTLVEEDVDNMKEKGWDIEYLSFPRRFTNHPDYTIDLEIIEVDDLGFNAYKNINHYER